VTRILQWRFSLEFPLGAYIAAKATGEMAREGMAMKYLNQLQKC